MTSGDLAYMQIGHPGACGAWVRTCLSLSSFVGGSPTDGKLTGIGPDSAAIGYTMAQDDSYFTRPLEVDMCLQFLSTANCLPVGSRFGSFLR